MKLNKLFFLLFLFTPALKAESGSGFIPAIKEAVTGLKRHTVGSQLAPLDDPRVMALIAAGVLTTCAGVLIAASVFSDDEKSKELSFFKKIAASLTADGLILGGILEILFARALITAADEASHQALQKWNEFRYQS